MSASISMYRALLAALLAAGLPAAAHAQAPSCVIPKDLPRPRLEGATQSEPRRNLPIGSYTLALSWSPQHCAGGERSLQCGPSAMGRFGFVLHGLWPDGEGKVWPQYCRPASLVPQPILRGALCATPSVQLVQHEWAKHGTCMSRRPEDYFAKSGALYRTIRYPDMASLAQRKGLTVGAFARSFAAANRGMRADMLRVQTSRNGMLSEVWVCLDTRFALSRCPGGQRPDRLTAPVRIAYPWR